MSLVLFSMIELYLIGVVDWLCLTSYLIYNSLIFLTCTSFLDRSIKITFYFSDNYFWQFFSFALTFSTSFFNSLLLIPSWVYFSIWLSIYFINFLFCSSILTSNILYVYIVAVHCFNFISAVSSNIFFEDGVLKTSCSCNCLIVDFKFSIKDYFYAIYFLCVIVIYFFYRDFCLSSATSFLLSIVDESFSSSYFSSLFF